MLRLDNGHKYYAYMILYVDDCLHIHHDVETTLVELDKYFAMKKHSISEPDFYLGAKLCQVQLDNDMKAWGMSLSKLCPGSNQQYQKIFGCQLLRMEAD